LSNLTKGLILVVAIIAVGAGLAIWKKKLGHSGESFNSISREEIELLVGDMAKQNPMMIKQIAQRPEMKKKQLDNLKQILAFASEAQREGLANDPTNRQTLNDIKAEIIAVSYDREINKDKGPMPPFGFITDDQVKAYFGEDPQAAGQNTPADANANQAQAKPAAPAAPALSQAEKEKREAEFQKFLDARIEMAKAENPELADRQITDDEKQQLKDDYAKVHIYLQEYEDKVKSGALDATFQQKADLQVKLQQAAFLTQIYSKKHAAEMDVTDDDVNQYIAAHPELNADKKAKAQDVLNRAKNGEDFAALANQYSEDPGNKSDKGEGKGGEYKDVKKGDMVAPFEQAALALEPGQITPELVESDYGYHIIKLEKKTDTKDASGNPTQTYDVRHILISTTYTDPNNPTARPQPLKQYIKQKLSTDKQKKLVDELVARNNVSVPDDYTLPEVTDDQIKDAMKNQGGPMMAPPASAPSGDDTKPSGSDKKPAATKKGK